MLGKKGIFTPDICPCCDKKPKSKKHIHLMNIDHKYSENTLDWYFMCRDCHLGKYHYLAGLEKRNGKIKPIPNIIKNLLQLRTRKERGELLKEMIY